MMRYEALALGIILSINAADSCSCFQSYFDKTFCERVQDHDVVVHATALNRSTPADVYDSYSTSPVGTFTVDIKTVYQGDPEDPDSLTFSTCAGSGCCGVDLDIGEDYLLGLDRISDGFWAHTCGLVWGWSDGFKTMIEDCVEDPCEGACVDPQECVLYDQDEGYVCAFQSCDPNPCLEGETCTIFESLPPIVECSTEEEDECGGCPEFQECLLFDRPEEGAYEEGMFSSEGTEGPEGDWWYCADTCAPGRCDIGEFCELLPTSCPGPFRPCPPVAVCRDNCRGECEDDQECYYVHPHEDYTCASEPCDPSPCQEGETCTILTSDPPQVACDPEVDECGGSCLEFQECMIYTDGNSGAEQPYCADVCDGRCGDEETCSLVDVTCVQNPCPPVAECTGGGGGDGYEYVGCFKDVKEDRVLGHQFTSDDMTTEICLTHCESYDAAYMATQYSRECWCDVVGSTDYDRHGGEEDGAVCGMPCAGDEGETCGGLWAFSLHKLAWPEAPIDNSEYVGCYRDTRDDRVMTDETAGNGMDPVVCREYCVDRDALYYGTQYKSECWCGYSDEMSDYTRHGEGVCHLPCLGDDSIACGGYYAFGLFKVEPENGQRARE